MAYLRVGFFVLGVSAALSAATAQEERAFVRWAITEDFISNAPNNPLVVRDMVIVGTDMGQLRAYGCKDGNSVWVHQHGERIFHRPCSDGERIYFSSEKGLTAVKVDDGTFAWNFSLFACDGPPHVIATHGKVYVGGHDGNLCALDVRTGHQMWSADFVADAPPDPPLFDGAKARMANTKARPTALASDGETLFLSVFDQCRIVAFNAANARKLWSFQSGGWVFGSAVATEKHVFFGSQDKSYYCLDKQTGTKVWSHPTKSRVESGGAVDDAYVYFASCDGGLYCLNQADGEPRWRFAIDKPQGHTSAIYSVPILHQGSVYFAAGEGQAYAVHQQSGELEWRVRPSEGSELFCSPDTDGTSIFLTTRADFAGKGAASLLAIGL
jgi:outer membrane protein assembly factor BamB